MQLIYPIKVLFQPKLNLHSAQVQIGEDDDEDEEFFVLYPRNNYNHSNEWRPNYAMMMIQGYNKSDCAHALEAIYFIK